MANWEEQRRAPRTVVDVEAVLHLSGLTVCPGVIHDLSYLGALFVPEKAMQVQPAAQGSMRFALPTARQWLEPSVLVRRISSFPRPGGGEGHAFGTEFFGLSSQDQQAVSDGCAQWDSHRIRQATFNARCYVQSEGGLTGYARFGQLVGGTRNYVRLKLPAGQGLGRGMRIRLKIAREWVTGEVEQVSPDSDTMEVLVRLEGWGRDFFLHEAARESGSP
ncbi:MAG TPA: PilZ domain-containing protein [Chloroflexota bacterium]